MHFIGSLSCIKQQMYFGEGEKLIIIPGAQCGPDRLFFPLDFQILLWICTTVLVCVSLYSQNNSALVDTQSDAPAPLLYLLSLYPVSTLEREKKSNAFSKPFLLQTQMHFTPKQHQLFVGCQNIGLFCLIFIFWHFVWSATSIWQRSSLGIYHLTPLSYWCVLQMKLWLKSAAAAEETTLKVEAESRYG